MSILCDEFEVIKENKKIAGKRYYSDNTTKSAAIIISHGFGGSMQDLEKEGHFFAQHGYVAITFDYCGGSDPKRTKSSGETEEMNIFTEREDLVDVVNYIKGMDLVDNKKIILMGYSQGGFVSGLVASYIPEDILNLVMVFPAICIPDHARLGMLGGAVYDIENVPDSWECPNGMVIGKQFHERVLDFDPYVELRKYKKNVLIIHGTEDSVVDYSYSVKAHRNYEKGQSHLQLVRNADHGFSPSVGESVLTSVLCFLQGKKEVLDIKVFLKGSKQLEKRTGYWKQEVYFGGYCDNEYFMGTIKDGAKDTQYQKEGEEVHLKAEYELEGIDCEGNKCSISIINEKDGEFFKPRVKTDSEALSFLNSADLVATLEEFENGLSVRIYG